MSQNKRRSKQPKKQSKQNRAESSSSEKSLARDAEGSASASSKEEAASPTSSKHEKDASSQEESSSKEEATSQNKDSSPKGEAASQNKDSLPKEEVVPQEEPSSQKKAASSKKEPASSKAEGKDAKEGPSSSTSPAFDPGSGTVSWSAWWKTPSRDADGKDDSSIQFALVAISLLLFTTQLGFGLYDCWEPHYAETARMMMVRKDWLHPYWSYAYFLSKPALMFWYMAASMSVFGINEWAVRLPFALHAVLLIWGVYFILSRLFSSRAGLLAAVAVGTSPLTGFLGRQALSDILVVTYLTLALGFLALALFGDKRSRDAAEALQQRTPVHLPYLTVFYVLIGLSLLAKGLLGLGIAGAVFLGYLAFTFDVASLIRLRMLRGAVIAGVIALPWYIHMISFPGRNIDDHKTFFERFILHDNVYRVFGGVHGERGDFVYFVRQLGYSLGPWLGFLPFGLSAVARFRGSDQTQERLSSHEQLNRFLFSWWFVTFVFLTLSQTKFHHYVFPVVPISAMLIAIWIDRYLSGETGTAQRFALIIIFGIVAMVMRDYIHEPKNLINLFVYKYERSYPADTKLWGLLPSGGLALTPNFVFRNIFVLFGFGLALGFFYEMRKYAVQVFCGAAVLLAVYNTHFFMVRLSKHWSQRALFETLKKDSPLWDELLSSKKLDARAYPIPDEPLFAFKMNWRGEQFYGLNHDLQIMGTNAYSRLYDAIQRNRKPGRPVYFLTEATRFDQLKRGVGSYDAPLLRVLDKSNNKYILVKLLPRSTSSSRDPKRLDRDRKNREYYDNWVRKWRKDQRKKKKVQKR
ncbi:MAG: glycosyltransferase family 39 protein [Myxococcales bacterium]|nr:glycosyltransferase family 39 protein [Myxococcales bacterium]